MNILLTGIPIPPSLNNCYVNNRRTGGRFPSRELKDFKSEVFAWRHGNLRAVAEARALLVAKFASEQRFIRVDRYFCLESSRIYTKDGRAKRLDVTNRIKCLDDAVSEMLGLDDCWFVSGFCEKLAAIDGNRPAPEQAMVCLSFARLRNSHELTDGQTPWPVLFQRTTL